MLTHCLAYNGAIFPQLLVKHVLSHVRSRSYDVIRETISARFECNVISRLTPTPHGCVFNVLRILCMYLFCTLSHSCRTRAPWAISQTCVLDLSASWAKPTGCGPWPAQSSGLPVGKFSTSSQRLQVPSTLVHSPNNCVEHPSDRKKSMPAASECRLPFLVRGCRRHWRRWRPPRPRRAGSISAEVKNLVNSSTHVDSHSLCV